MGFQPQTLPAKNGMVVRLSEDTYALQEVVAIGYGSQKKKEVTGSVASVKAEDFNAGVKSNPMGLLQGKVAGLNISRQGSDPTSTGYNIQIRGFISIVGIWSGHRIGLHVFHSGICHSHSLEPVAVKCIFTGRGKQATEFLEGVLLGRLHLRDAHCQHNIIQKKIWALKNKCLPLQHV